MISIFTLFNKYSYQASFRRSDNLKLILDFVELAIVILSIPLSYVITDKILTSFGYIWYLGISQMLVFSVLILISWFVLSQVTAMAKLPATKRYLTLFFHQIRVHFVVLIILLLLKFVFNFRAIPVVFILVIVPVSMFITFAIRILATHKFRIYASNGYNLRHVVLIADGCSTNFIQKLMDQKDWGFKIQSIVTRSKTIKEKFGKEIKLLPETEDLKNYLDNNVVDELIYSKRRIDHEEIRNYAEMCKEVGVIFRYQSYVSKSDALQVRLQTFDEHNQLPLVDIPSNNLPLVIKNVADIYFSITAVILLFPVFIIIALLIKMESKGPVLFKQERIGLRGRKFRLFKFRTMIVNAEEMLDALRKNNEMDGPTFKMKDDPRTTKIGKFLRKTGLDELPQFFNVISGEMSLIGPRPPLESEVKQYERWQLRRLSVKPGITCTWQIIPNRNDVKFEKWMQLDLHYIDNWSLAKDAELFFKTITTVFSGSGR